MTQDRKDILKAVAPAAVDATESLQLAKSAQEKRDYKSEIEGIDISNRLVKQALRRKWDKLLRWLVVLGFFLSYLMIFLIGIHKLTFPDNVFAVPSVIAVGIVQTYGLAKLAVRYFFSDDDKRDGSPPG
jgi:hypothetical protein